MNEKFANPARSTSSATNTPCHEPVVVLKATATDSFTRHPRKSSEIVVHETMRRQTSTHGPDALVLGEYARCNTNFRFESAQ